MKCQFGTFFHFVHHLMLFQAKAAIESSLKRLGLDYLNMCLIHMPGLPNQHDFVADQDMDREKPKETYPSTEVLQERRISMWQALQDLKKEGKIRDIGVSNFSHKHIEQLLNNPRLVNMFYRVVQNFLDCSYFEHYSL